MFIWIESPSVGVGFHRMGSAWDTFFGTNCGSSESTNRFDPFSVNAMPFERSRPAADASREVGEHLLLVG